MGSETGGGELDRGLLGKFAPDTPAIKLPTFDEFVKSGKEPAVPPRESAGFQSKLPAVNQGKSIYDIEPEEEKTGFEKFVFRGTIFSIGALIFIEIFVNTPFFANTVKPLVLQVLDG